MVAHFYYYKPKIVLFGLLVAGYSYLAGFCIFCEEDSRDFDQVEAEQRMEERGKS